MTATELGARYRAYIACLNAQDWPQVGNFVPSMSSTTGGRSGSQAITTCS